MRFLQAAVLGAAFLFAGALGAADSEEAAIRAVLDAQVEAWNRGDLEEFVSYYEDSPETSFLSSQGVYRGYAGLLERYRGVYPDKERMGRARFSELEIRVLEERFAVVLGRFHLTRPAEHGGDAEGRFTIVLRKTDAGWRIVHDHTS